MGIGLEVSDDEADSEDDDQDAAESANNYTERDLDELRKEVFRLFLYFHHQPRIISQCWEYILPFVFILFFLPFI